MDILILISEIFITQKYSHPTSPGSLGYLSKTPTLRWLLVHGPVIWVHDKIRFDTTVWAGPRREEKSVLTLQKLTFNGTNFRYQVGSRWTILCRRLPPSEHSRCCPHVMQTFRVSSHLCVVWYRWGYRKELWCLAGSKIWFSQNFFVLLFHHAYNQQTFVDLDTRHSNGGESCASQ